MSNQQIEHTSKPAPSPRFTDAEIRSAAEAACIHPATLMKCLAGLDVRGSAGVRARAAAAKLRGRR